SAKRRRGASRRSLELRPRPRLARALRPMRRAESGRNVMRQRQRCEREQSEAGAGQKGREGTVAVPKRAGKEAREESRETADEVEEAETRPAQFRLCDVGDERRKQPLRQAHVQAPENDPERDGEGSKGRGQHDIGAKEQQQSRGQRR